MAILNNNSLIGSSGQGGGYQIERSLRFNSADSAYLSRTPASAGNRTTWTWSGWVKRSKLGAVQGIFDAYSGGLDFVTAFFNSNDTIYFYTCSNIGSFVDYDFTTTAVFRDVSAWYHLVFVLDTNNATQADRFIVYVNGVRQAGTNPSGAFDSGVQTYINSTAPHRLGSRTDGNYHSNQYMAEVHFIDGQALTPSSFGEFDTDTGVWKPKAYSGSYGTNGFYLPLDVDTLVEGFNTVLYKGTGGKQRITGVGFKPDLIWVKSRSNGALNHAIFDSVRGTPRLDSSSTVAEGEYNQLSSYDNDGFTLLGETTVNESGGSYVAWAWKAGNSTVSNTDGSITASVRANPTLGFSIITHSGTGSNGTIGHGLGVAPKFVLTKRRSSAEAWTGWHTSLTSGTYNIELNTTNAQQSSPTHYTAAPTSTVINLGTNTASNASGSTYVTYAFAETGYSKFGSYTGNGSSTGPTVTTGWKPAFVLIKSSSRTGTEWHIVDNTRDTVSPLTAAIRANRADAEFQTTALNASCNVVITDTGFQVNGNVDHFNLSGETYIYMAVKDTREMAFWQDGSGNGNNWQPNNLDFNDPVVDTPTQYGIDTGVGGEVRGNYATFNPLGTNNNATFANGNLDTVSGSAASTVGTTFGMSTGKWYAEFVCTAKTSVNMYVAIVRADTFDGDNQADEGTNIGYLYLDIGRIYHGGAYDSYGSTWTVGDVIGVAFDVDTRYVTFYINGVSQGQYTRIASEYGTGYTWLMAVGEGQGSATASFTMNAGQRPFAYTAPSGFKALCTTNLPEPTIAEGRDYFNAVTYTGNNQTLQSITTVGFQPDLIWIKNRNASNHVLVDAVRGRGFHLASNLTNAEATDSSTQGVTAFLSNGFSVQADPASYGSVNDSTEPYVAWNWKANGAGVSNNAGTVTSTVSANTTAGFSIATFTGNSASNQTVGHGLGVAPSFIIVKVLGTSGDFVVYHRSIGADRFLILNATNGQSGQIADYWGTPSSTTFGIKGGGWSNNYNAQPHVAYCFAPVAGYSAMGSWVGNGSSDGPMIVTNFRPAFVLWKRTDTSGNNWVIQDNARSKPYNPADGEILPSSSAAESTSFSKVDLLSNGFKVRSTNGGENASGGTYIYAAFAENPFKYSLAR